MYLSYISLFFFFSKRIITHISKELMYHILGGISSVPAAGPVAAGMMLKQMGTVLTAIDVISMYKGVVPSS